MTLRHMKIFVQVFETENITKAAALLHMTQPAVSRAIQEIESYYGVCLFERINRRLSATESAKRLYGQALHIVDTFDTMEKELRNWESFGLLRVGASITLGNFLLPELVSKFQADHPNIKIQANISNSASLEQALLYNRLDIALIEGDPTVPELHTEPFGQDRLVLILPPKHPLLDKPRVTLADVAAFPLLLREKGSIGRALLEHVFARHDVPMQPLWESASTQAILKAAAVGLGLSFLPEQLVRPDLERGAVCTREVADVDLTRKNHLVWHERKYLTRSMREFIEIAFAGWDFVPPACPPWVTGDGA